MAAEELAAAMRHFQRTYGKPESVVDELFDAATERLWALTSKEQGAYEFEVVSLREYFAARFLYTFAGESDRHFDRTNVLAELLRRPYWLNTARFYAGNATGSDIYVVAGGIRDLLSPGAGPQVYIAAWTLVTDGVLISRPTEAATVIDALCTDTGAPILLEALHRKDISPLPALPFPPADDPTWIRLTGAIASSPASPENAQRARVLRELLSQRTQFGRWWADHAAASIGTPGERPWLELAAGCQAGAGIELDLTGAELADGGAQLILNSGIVPARAGRIEADLIAAVLDGQCPDTTSTRSLPAQIAVTLAPAAYRTSSDTAFNGIDEQRTLQRQEAMNLLRRAGSPFAVIAALRRFRKGERGSTFPWANTATALHNLVGACWLANEIAVIGAASKHKNGWTKVPGVEPFGPQGHPTALMAGARDHAGDTGWWRAGRETATDDLSRAVWALALWALAPRAVFDCETDEWARIVGELPASRVRALRSAAGNLQAWSAARDGSVGPRAASLVALAPAPDLSAPAPRPERKLESPTPETLASVARRAKWFKVDSAAIYR